MAQRNAFLCRETTETTGQSDIALSGVRWDDDHALFSEVLADGDTCYVTEHGDGQNWQILHCTYVSSTNTLEIDSVVFSTNGGWGGTAINWAAGTKDVWATMEQQAVGTLLVAAQNLADVDDAGTALANIGGLGNLGSQELAASGSNDVVFEATGPDTHQQILRIRASSGATSQYSLKRSATGLFEIVHWDGTSNAFLFRYDPSVGRVSFPGANKILLPAAPSADLEAATKKYVDDLIAGTSNANITMASGDEFLWGGDGSVPVGFTVQTTHNDRVPLIVGSAGGTKSNSGSWGGSVTVNGYALKPNEMPQHSHSGPSHTHPIGSHDHEVFADTWVVTTGPGQAVSQLKGSSGNGDQTTSSSSGTTGSGGTGQTGTAGSGDEHAHTASISSSWRPNHRTFVVLQKT